MSIDDKFAFFKNQNPLQTFNFNINGYYDLYKNNTANILKVSSNLIGSSFLIVRLFGYLTSIITFPLALLYAFGSAIVLFVMVIVQYVVNLVGFLFWGISGIATALISLGGMLWAGLCAVLQIVWVKMLALATLFVSVVIPYFINLNQYIVTKINSLTVSVPTDLLQGDFEGLAWLFFNKCEVNYLIEKSILQLIWFIEIVAIVWLTRKIIDFVKFCLR